MNTGEIRRQMIDARDEYVNLIKAELMGPGSEFPVPDAEHELISSSPVSRYSVGILFPQGNLVEQDNNETLEVGEEEGNREERDDPVPDGEDSIKAEKASSFNTDSTADFDAAANENLDEEVGMASQYKPSSMGMTFLVKGNTEKVHCKISFATYKNALLSDCVVPFEPRNGEDYSVPPEVAHLIVYDNENRVFKPVSAFGAKDIRGVFEQDSIPADERSYLRNVTYRLLDMQDFGYVRVPHTVEDVVLDFSASDYADNPENDSLDGTVAKAVALRTQITDDIWSVTVMLVNRLTDDSAKACECIFQSKIEVSTENNAFVFMENASESDTGDMDAEEQSLNLLYRHKKNYGTGLGTAVDWTMDETGHGSVWTDFFPSREIPSMSFSLPENDLIKNEELSMKYLSDLDKTDQTGKLTSMHKLVDLYAAWIDGLKKTATALGTRYQAAATRNIEECSKAARRMYEGIETLSADANAYAAFELANRAMFMQRIHIQKQGDMAKVDADRYPEDEEISDWLNNLDYRTESDKDCRWRPFQIAFLLMDINSIVHDDSADRSLVDLIWFPTGGGKTEAYLGLTAFTVFYRKLSYPTESDGTTVMMRYTLRLLAAQQFTRAATLICACEYIRQDSLNKSDKKYPKYSLGETPITIGLWIGGTHIPNKNEDAKEHLKKLTAVTKADEVRNAKDQHNKFQVLKCPWCGAKMVKDSKDGKLVGKWGYNMGKGNHFYMFCPHEDCLFTERLPIQIIDDELYAAPPTLLFGTVDKFAMMAWDGRIGSFFAVGSENRSPDLIIQDELHLISGALGTMVGLYETAVDGLSSMKGIPPKIIASTATIRRAKEQCSVLYNREIVQFPAPGLDAEDSFFAKEDTINYDAGKYGRKYVGVMPSGRTKAMIEIRAMAALLQKMNTKELPDEVKDKLWTLTVYFNSLRDLGKASTLVDDDVKDFIIRTANRMLTPLRRLIVSPDELTSRVTTTELNETLDKLEKVEYSKANRDNKKYASDILLATNMISVGIDVARLNVMLMIGQPKLTSEYIQASSRVGRSYPGVVFVQYDATKSRDRSHYERFRAYHDSFYRFVEPTGATPFSRPARERGLHAVMTTLIRNKAPLGNDKDANNFDSTYFADLIQETEQYIMDRVKGIYRRSDVQLLDDTADIETEMNDFIKFWQKKVINASGNDCPPLKFGRGFMVTPPSGNESRLLKQYNSSGTDDAKPTLTSMRNVDSSVKGDVIIWED